MMGILIWVAFGLTLVASGGILLLSDWRWKIGLLAAQYLGFFWLVQISWSIPLAAVKLVTGWMICVGLGIAHLDPMEGKIAELSWPQGQLFRVAVIGLILIVTFVGSLGLGNWLGIPLPAAWGGLLLIGMGLLNIGITSEPFHVIVGLLTLLSGFEIVYASVESSAMVAGLLVIINLGLAMAGAYFLIHPGERSAL